MKKFIIVLTSLIFSILFIGEFNLNKKLTHATGEYENFLISPTALAVTQTSIYIADQESNEFILYDLNSKERMSSVTLSGVKCAKISDETIYVLAKTSGNNLSLYTYDLNLQNAKALSFPTTYFAEGTPIDFVILEDEIKVLKSDGNSATIDSFSVSGESLIQDPLSTAVVSSLGFSALISDLLSLNISENEIILTYKTGIHAYNTTTHSTTKLFDPTTFNSLIKHSTDEYAILENGAVIKLSSKEVVINTSLKASGIASYGDKVYISSRESHQVFVCNNSAINDLGLNPEIMPTLFSAQNFVHIKLTSSSNFKLKPYSADYIKTETSGKHITVVGEKDNYYYCMLVGNENEFLYLDKTTNNFEIINSGSSNTTYTATLRTNIYSYPSTNEDDINTIKEVINPGETIVVKNSTIIENSKGESFYLVECENGFGFVRSSYMQSTKGRVELTSPCNAKTKRATTLFEKADGSGEIIVIEKGTRIALQEETAPTKDYILVEYQDVNGIIYKGYVLSDDIDPDGLSTLQILGLVLVGTNLALLLTVLLIKRNSKKWKV